MVNETNGMKTVKLQNDKMKIFPNRCLKLRKKQIKKHFWEGNTMFILFYTQIVFIDVTVNKHL